MPMDHRNMEEAVAEEKPPANDTCESKSASMHELDVSNEDENSKSNDDNSFNGKGETDDVEHHFEECIRDLCIMRKSMPQKCSQLLENYYEVVTPDFEKYRTKMTEDNDVLQFDDEHWKKGMTELKEQAENWKDIKPLKLHSLEERCKKLIELENIRAGMGLNRTQELLFSGKRKAEVSGNDETENNVSKRVMEAENDISSLVVTPDLHAKQENFQSSTSLIPRIEKDSIAPVIPLAHSTSL